MGTVTNLAEYRARKLLSAGKAPPPPRPAKFDPQLRKKEITQGVVDRYRWMLGTARVPMLNAAVRMISSQVARKIVRSLRDRGESLNSSSRFQFFGLKEGEDFWLVGRVSAVYTAEGLLSRSASFLVSPTDSALTEISSSDKIAKNNTFTTLITLPMSEFYNL